MMFGIRAEKNWAVFKIINRSMGNEFYFTKSFEWNLNLKNFNSKIKYLLKANVYIKNIGLF